MTGARALDPAKSSFVVHTFAAGLLARLAHDLELQAGGVTGALEEEGGLVRVRVRAPVDGLRVVGAVKKGRVDPAVLSASDRVDIEKKLRTEVFAGRSELSIEGRLEGARATLQVQCGTARVELPATATRVGDEITGRCELSLKALGLRGVEGPMGAFKLADRVEVLFRTSFPR